MIVPKIHRHTDHGIRYDDFARLRSINSDMTTVASIATADLGVELRRRAFKVTRNPRQTRHSLIADPKKCVSNARRLD